MTLFELHWIFHSFHAIVVYSSIGTKFSKIGADYININILVSFFKKKIYIVFSIILKCFTNVPFCSHMTLIAFPMAFEVVFKILQKIKKIVPSQFVLFFSNTLQMALIALSKIFKVLLKNLQTIESRTLKSEGTIINILVTFKDSHKLLFFSIVLMALTAFPKACEVILKTSKNLQLVPLDLRVQISTFSSPFSKFSFMFFKCFTNGPCSIS